MAENKYIKQKRQKGNLTKVSELISVIKENLCLEKNQKAMALREIWPLITSFETAKYSQPAYFDKENNLVIFVKNGSLAVELSMQKVSILKGLRKATENTDINFKDIRFITRNF